MLVEAAAWSVVVFHVGYLLYAIFGGFLGLLRTRWTMVHLVSSAWCITVTATAVTCPLTAVEKWLIRASGGTPYDDTFIGHYLEGPVYPEGYDAHVWYGGAAIALSSYLLLLARRVQVRAADTALQANLS